MRYHAIVEDCRDTGKDDPTSAVAESNNLDEAIQMLKFYCDTSDSAPYLLKAYVIDTMSGLMMHNESWEIASDY